LSMVVISITMDSCKKDPIVDPNEGELITTVKVKLTDLQMGNTSVSEFIFQDLDGEGGVAPQKFDEIQLSKGRNYKCEIELLNESTTPVDQVTAEVLSEAVDHQIYLIPNPSNLVSIVYGDKDANNLPIGITSYWTTGMMAGSGIMNITLKHKPGFKKVDDLVSVGDTDVSIDFKIKIQ
jgi:hypothetical protein